MKKSYTTSTNYYFAWLALMRWEWRVWPALEHVLLCVRVYAFKYNYLFSLLPATGTTKRRGFLRAIYDSYSALHNVRQLDKLTACEVSELSHSLSVPKNQRHPCMHPRWTVYSRAIIFASKTADGSGRPRSSLQITYLIGVQHHCESHFV